MPKTNKKQVAIGIAAEKSYLLKVEDTLKEMPSSEERATWAQKKLGSFFENKIRELNNLDFFDKKQKLDIKQEIILFKQKGRMNELLNFSAEKIKEYTDNDEEIKQELAITQAKINYILADLNSKSQRVSSNDIVSVPTFFSSRPIDEPIYKKINKLKNNRCVIEVISRLSRTQQKVSYALQSAELANIRLNDLGTPYHPLESELLDIIEGKASLEIMPEKYTARHKLGAVGFYNEHYRKYIEAKVIFQDYLSGIDPVLMQALKNAIKNASMGEKAYIRSIIPPNSFRKDNLSSQLRSNSELRRKAYRVHSLL